MLSILRKKIISGLLICSIGVSFCPVQAFSWGSLFGKKAKKVVQQVKTATKKKSMWNVFGWIAMGVCALVLIRLRIMRRRRGNNDGGSGSGKPRPDNSNKKDFGQKRDDFNEACKKGDLEAARKFVDSEKEDPMCDDYINDPDWGKDGNSALHNACESGDLKLVRFLFNSLKNKNRKSDLVRKSILDSACEGENNEIFKFLVRAESDRNIDYSKEKYKSPIHVACDQGNIELVRWLVEEMSYDVNLEDQFGRTPLHMVSRKGHLDIVKYLLYQSANVRAAKIKAWQFYNALPVHIACRFGHFDVVKYFVEECSIEADVIDGYGRTPIVYALKSKNKDLVRWIVPISKKLLNKKIVDHQKEAIGRTIHSDQKVWFVRQEIKNEINKTPIEIAEEEGKTHIVEILRKAAKEEEPVKEKKE